MADGEKCLMIIFGASGDLARRKLIPSLFELYDRGLLPNQFAALGVSRTKLNDDSFRSRMEEALSKDLPTDGKVQKKLKSFIGSLFYAALDPGSVQEFEALTKRLADFGSGDEKRINLLFYLATPPVLYHPIAENLARVGLNRSSTRSGWRRIVVEKPFGTDFPSASDLNQKLKSHFQEDQIYRIDHYLGKETVQNVFVTRFSNGIFEPLWNRNYVSHVEITAAESLGVDGRGGYYDQAGALRDMVQNHLLQLVALIAMEPPAITNATAIRNEVVKVFESLRPMSEDAVRDQVMRGQYTEARIRGELVPGYRQLEGVAHDSRTETYAAMKFYIDNWRWGGVPFYIRTGKMLPTRVTEAVIHFRPTPHCLFLRGPGPGNPPGNTLVLRIQPDEGILLRFGMKVPGAGFRVQDVAMDFHYSDLKETYLPSAYERLILDSIQGDATLFARGDAVEAAWRFIDPIVNAWASDPSIPVHGYPVGTWGPEKADQLFPDPSLGWRYPCRNLVDDGIYCEL